jgi:phosphoglucosamine mutase
VTGRIDVNNLNSENNPAKRKYFGTDGIRGVAGVAPLNPEMLVLLGKAIAKLFMRRGGKHRILLGKDTRVSGYMIENALTSGITAMGGDVLLVGPLPTPGVAYMTRSMRADAGIMVSASHNPFSDNGIKIFGADGYKLPDEVEAEIEALLDSPSELLYNADPCHLGKATRIHDAVGRYTVFLKGAFPRELSFEGFRVGLDAAHGAGYTVAPQVLTEMGAEVISRGASPNGRNINAGFGSLYPEVVRSLVLEQNLSLGISLDGDADRCILVDERGSVVDGDMILALCAADLKDRGLLPSNRVIATVMSNVGLERFLAARSIELVRTGVGDRYVLEEMLRTGSELGGEQSGHTIFGAHSTTGDGIFTALKVLSIMFRRQKPLSELLADYQRFPQKLVNVSVSQRIPLEAILPFKALLDTKEEELKGRGRVLVRYSGTENKVRIMVEAETEDQCKKHASELASVIERELGAV